MDCATLVGRLESALAGRVAAEAGVASTARATASATVAATLSVAVMGLAAGDVPAVTVVEVVLVVEAPAMGSEADAEPAIAVLGPVASDAAGLVVVAVAAATLGLAAAPALAAAATDAG